MQNLEQIHEEFPILNQEINGRKLVYFDNAATTQKPHRVIDAISDYYRGYNSNIHRGAHHLAHKATEKYEDARSTIADFIGASSEEINFVRGTTEGVNLIARTFGETLSEGDAILLTEDAHHANIVPWQMLQKRKGIELVVLPVDDYGNWEVQQLDSLLNENIKLAAISHTSNATGVRQPFEEVITKVRAQGGKILIDAAQAMVHKAIDVQKMQCDFLVFSGHKMYGPTGIGVCYGRKEIMDACPPFMGGGEMIAEVSFSGTTFNKLPFKFEAGTPNIAGAIGLAEACTFIQSLGFDAIKEKEHTLSQALKGVLEQHENLQLLGDLNSIPVASFNLDGVHAYDLGVLLDQQAIAVRTGHHCCQPLMKKLGIEGTCRASLAIYNSVEEIERFGEALNKAKMMLQS